MKISLDLIRHLNAVLLLGFCILYPSLRYGINILYGVFVWTTALIFLFLPNIIRRVRQISEREAKYEKTAAIFASWGWAAFQFFLLLSDRQIKANHLLFAFAVLLIIVAGIGILQWKERRASHSKEHV